MNIILEVNKEKTWNEYTEEKKEEYENSMGIDGLKAYIKIKDIPNWKEFKKLATILRDNYPDKYADFLITDTGFKKLYYLFNSSGLFNMLEIMETINERFSIENMEEFEIKITDFLPRKDMSNEEFTLYMTKNSRVAIQRILQDAKINNSEFGLICCIFTFNRAKEEFDSLITDNFKVYYKDDGYVKTITEKIYISAKQGILWLINILPRIFEDIQKVECVFKEHESKGIDIGQEDIELNYKKRAAEKVVDVVINSGIAPVRTRLDIEVYRDMQRGIFCPAIDLTKNIYIY